jgi:hypothetical protein
LDGAKEVLERTVHTKCFRHIKENLKQRFPDGDDSLYNLSQEAATAPTALGFAVAVAKMYRLNEAFAISFCERAPLFATYALMTASDELVEAVDKLVERVKQEQHARVSTASANAAATAAALEALRFAEASAAAPSDAGSEGDLIELQNRNRPMPGIPPVAVQSVPSLFQEVINVQQSLPPFGDTWEDAPFLAKHASNVSRSACPSMHIDGVCMFNNTTSNGAEQLNSAMVPLRHLPVDKAIASLQDLMATHAQRSAKQSRKQLAKGQTVTTFALTATKNNVELAEELRGRLQVKPKHPMVREDKRVHLSFEVGHQPGRDSHIVEMLFEPSSVVQATNDVHRLSVYRCNCWKT